MDKRTGGGTWVEEINIFDLMMNWSVGMTINDGIDLIKFIFHF